MDSLVDYNDTGDYDALFLAVHNGDLNFAQKYSSAKKIRGRTLLHVAAARGHAEIVKMFAKRDEDGNTPLHLAIKENQPTVVNYLLQECNVNAKNLRDERPIHYAALYNRQEFTKSLIDNGASVNVKDIEGKTPLDLALAKQNLQTAEILFKNGAALSAYDLKYMVSLRSAAQSGNLEMVKLLMSKGLNKVDSSLSTAVTHGHLEVVKYLMDNGLKEKETIIEDRQELFHRAIKAGRLDIFQYLVDVGVKSEEDHFYDAIFRKRHDIWKYLFTCASKINAKTYFSETLLHSSVRMGHVETVKILVNNPADDFEPNSLASRLAVYIAVEYGSEEILRVLLNAGYSVESCFENTSPIHTAATFERTRLVKMLIGAGADVNSQTKHLYTPLHFAAAAGQPMVVKLLLDSGADPSKGKKYSEFPLIMVFDMFSPSSLHCSIIPAPMFKKLIKITEMLIPFSKNASQLFQCAFNLRVSSNCRSEQCVSNFKSEDEASNEENMKKSEFRSEIVECIFNYMTDEEIKSYSESLINHYCRSDYTLEQLQLILEYNDFKSCDTIQVNCPRTNYESKVLLIGYSKNAKELWKMTSTRCTSCYLNTRKDKDREFCKLIVARLVLLLTRNCHPSVYSFCEKNRLTSWRKKCEKECASMKETKVTDGLNITYYDVLTVSVNQLSMYVKNENFLKAVESSYSNFPAYADFLKINVENGKRRKNFMNQCVTLMDSLVKRNHKICISNANINQIFQYLSVVDLRRFSAVFF
ncbi:serine/threonine-protein phosphatase 6 regulatory ankyrin repeat subunit C-like [Leptopilina heterotoma]|uniref:serine/threonine-protein phosphatase 6 regulatory ankyrin repeat subunit C-like n=1 Tax=Leptopilina heterotoma TaxID=63436 RepID=UPI001CA8BB66|nr:serine/threonine-protein phosphatase 6 regulatory ankyrin repeat subunit C-like [Leptopilina heterotoma]XP_043469332.1 serine/threonine-protein phosphatase 6 regulatory ankyrin repeat subunit C-like [Leptopilina heterotoma]